MQVKLFPRFTNIPFDYLLISWVTNYVSNLGFLVDMLNLDCTCINRELQSLGRLELKFGLSSEFFDNIPVRILLMCSFDCSGFLKRPFMPCHLHS